MVPRTPENLVRHELIGLQTDVTEASDPGITDVSGTVVDETRNTLVIRAETTEKTVPKAGAVFRFHLDETVDVQGDLLVARPEERILKKFPRKWEYTPESE